MTESRYWFRLLRGALTFGVVLGGGLSLGLSLALGPPRAWGVPLTLLMSLAAGIVGIGVLAMIDFCWRYRFFRRYGVRSFDLIQRRQVTVPAPIEITRRAVESALRGLRGVRSIRVDRDRLFARRRVWRGPPADVIEVRLNASDGGSVAVSILSRPRLRMAVVDYGSNLETAEALTQALAELPRSSPP